MQLVRGVLLIGSSLCFFIALKYLPLADATAINYPTPMLVIVLAVVFLGERMTPRAARSSLAGRRRDAADRAARRRHLQRARRCWRSARPRSTRVYQIMTRMLAGEDPRVTLFYPALVGVGDHDAVWPWFGSQIDVAWTDVALMLALGVLGTVGHFLFILAFQRAPASALTPFTYVQLVFATLIGWLVFGDFPDGSTFAGMAVIAGSGLLITLHERRRALIAAPEPTAVD